MFTLLYKDFLSKAVTFSYDDGTFYDVFLVELFHKYGIKGTFNINSGLFGAMMHIDFGHKIVYHNRLSEDQTAMLYKGHELAAHSLTHPLLTGQTKEVLDREVLTDMANLDRITGEKTVGFVIPGGPHDETLDTYLRDKVLYERTAAANHSFELPEDFHPFDPTVFHMDPEFLPLCKEYVRSAPDHATWLYIWGHSYEFSLFDTYKNLSEACEMFASCKDLWIAPNRDIIGYVQCGRRIREEKGQLINDTDCDIYGRWNGKNVVVPAHARISQ